MDLGAIIAFLELEIDNDKKRISMQDEINLFDCLI